MNSGKTDKSFTQSSLSVLLGFIVVLLFFAGTGIVSYKNNLSIYQDVERVAHTHEVLTGLSEILGYMRDAETGQRGYLITGSESYLAPYKQAIERIDGRIKHVSTLISDNPEQQKRLEIVQGNVSGKLKELAETIQLRRSQGFDVARVLVLTDRGKNEMDTLRSTISSMQDEERRLRALRKEQMSKSYRTAFVSGLLSALLGIVLASIIASIAHRSLVARRREQWLQQGQLGLASAMVGEQRLEELGRNILKFFADYLSAQAGAFFVRHGKEFTRMGTYGVPEKSPMPQQFFPGDGLLGEAVKDGKPVLIDEIPENYLTFGSAMGHTTPHHLLIVPAQMNRTVNSVMELGFMKKPDDINLTLIQNSTELIAAAVRSAKYRAELQEFLEETQRQSEELQTQSEELRVSNEELEEQSRALKESQFRLEQQQAELEQNNSQLEEQTQTLESQRDDLSRAKNTLQAKARELEMASQYKSDFLANMSHELRTPLNSSLILAKLLADNPKGNLSEEQVKFAQTIQSAGNDLLTLINDILDLSKIEAGHMDLHPEAMSIERLASDLSSTFEPLAREKGLAFNIDLSPSLPKTVETDRLRVEQILKNLLSNAFKFTHAGSVTLFIVPDKEDGVIFAVKDTGIGISEEQQQMIFDAFRQADGTINRKYGGTGLGLSISRELTRLLGGRLNVQSESGSGSVFSLSLPARFVGAPRETQNFGDYFSGQDEPPKQQTIDRNFIDDDRQNLNRADRTILVVEDDESFVQILQDLSHELGFKCLVATTAEEALTIARQYMPSAIVLDVGLPDNSGLSVLDRLKRDNKTRHIPVHIVSAEDYTETALSLGAAGYLLKPVKRDDLASAFKKLEERFSQSLRRVLLVEDDEVQRDSVIRLLETGGVETVAVGSAADCLGLLKEQTFDCMILDLSLPDATGYSLLETLSNEDAYSFPPVIVYTGRDISSEDEQKLRRYSKSIIIKGAKSPERLLDEVTLFLHQVVSDLPKEQQRMIEESKNRDSILEGRRILIVEDDIRNVYAVTNIFEPLGAIVQIARNGVEALAALDKAKQNPDETIHLVLMDVMMPEMDGLTATREIRKNRHWKKLPIIMLTAKAMRDDQERCLEAGANDYMSKPLDVEKLLSLVRVWMPR